MTDAAEIFNEHRPLLFSIAYRMLGSAADAEDIVQESFVRFRQRDERDVRAPKAYLATIATRLCLDHLSAERARRESYVGPWLPEPVPTDTASAAADPERGAALAESLSMAFLVMLESLTPVERAVFLLHEVFEYDYDEVALVVGKTEANCRQIFRRAREHVAARRPRFDAAPEQQSRLVGQFMDATARGDMGGLLALMAEEITVYSDGGGKVTAARRPVRGGDHVARFFLGLVGKIAPERLRFETAEINGQPAVVSYLDGYLQSVAVFDIHADRIRNVYIVVNPDKLRAFAGGLPISS